MAPLTRLLLRQRKALRAARGEVGTLRIDLAVAEAKRAIAEQRATAAEEWCRRLNEQLDFVSRERTARMDGEPT